MLFELKKGGDSDARWEDSGPAGMDQTDVCDRNTGRVLFGRCWCCQLVFWYFGLILVFWYFHFSFETVE